MSKFLKYFFKNRKSVKRKSLLGPFAKGVIYETENGTIAMPVEDITIGKKLGFNGAYDIEEIDFIKTHINPEDTIYIVGTHVGTLLVPLAKKARKIIGYEANENTYKFATMNLSLNNLGNVRLFNHAVGNKNQKVSFYQNTVNTGGSKIKPDKELLRYTYDHPKTVAIDMVTLDDHINKESLDQPDGMIMDIEGAEYAALQGMQNTLRKLRFFYVEYVPHHLEHIANVSNEDFLKLITPHFKNARCMHNKRDFSLNTGHEKLLSYLEQLEQQKKTDDILFYNE